MRDYDAIVAQILALLQQETGEQCGWGHHRSARRRNLLKISLQGRMYVYKRLSTKSFHGV
jgi:hypothetical protein